MSAKPLTRPSTRRHKMHLVSFTSSCHPSSFYQPRCRASRVNTTTTGANIVVRESIDNKVQVSPCENARRILIRLSCNHVPALIYTQYDIYAFLKISWNMISQEGKSDQMYSKISLEEEKQNLTCIAKSSFDCVLSDFRIQLSSLSMCLFKKFLLKLSINIKNICDENIWRYYIWSIATISAEFSSRLYNCPDIYNCHEFFTETSCNF